MLSGLDVAVLAFYKYLHAAASCPLNGISIFLTRSRRIKKLLEALRIKINQSYFYSPTNKNEVSFI